MPSDQHTCSCSARTLDANNVSAVMFSLLVLWIFVFVLLRVSFLGTDLGLQLQRQRQNTVQLLSGGLGGGGNLILPFRI